MSVLRVDWTEPEGTLLADLPIGTVFEWEGEVFMKIEENGNVIHKHHTWTVNFDTHMLYSFSPQRRVKPVKSATLVVEG